MEIKPGSYNFDGFTKPETELKILEHQAKLAIAMEQDIWEETGLKPEMEVLDLGCGNGIISGIMAEYVHAGSVLGVDSSEVMIARAEMMRQEKKILNLRFMTGDAYSLNLPGRNFDFIYCRFLFQHLSAPEKALRNLVRILKPNGVICIVDIDDSWLILQPEQEDVRNLIARSARAQAQDGGNRYIGRKLPVYLHSAGLDDINNRIKVLSSFEVGLKAFVRLAFDFRVERLPQEEEATATLELENIHRASKDKSAWGALGIFIATGKKNN